MQYKLKPSYQDESLKRKSKHESGSLNTQPFQVKNNSLEYVEYELPLIDS